MEGSTPMEIGSEEQRLHDIIAHLKMKSRHVRGGDHGASAAQKSTASKPPELVLDEDGKGATINIGNLWPAMKSAVPSSHLKESVKGDDKKDVCVKLYEVVKKEVEYFEKFERLLDHYQEKKPEYPEFKTLLTSNADGYVDMIIIQGDGTNHRAYTTIWEDGEAKLKRQGGNIKKGVPLRAGGPRNRYELLDRAYDFHLKDKKEREDGA